MKKSVYLQPLILFGLISGVLGLLMFIPLLIKTIHHENILFPLVFVLQIAISSYCIYISFVRAKKLKNKSPYIYK